MMSDPDPDPNDIPDDESGTGGPIADKGEVSAPRHGTDEPADGPGGTPGAVPESADDEAGRRELDFEDGAPLDDAEITQGDSVVEAEYADRGPADHLDEGVDASAAADVADPSAGDRLSGTGLETDTDTPLPKIDDR